MLRLKFRPVVCRQLDILIDFFIHRGRYPGQSQLRSAAIGGRHILQQQLLRQADGAECEVFPRETDRRLMAREQLPHIRRIDTERQSPVTDEARRRHGRAAAGMKERDHATDITVDGIFDEARKEGTACAMADAGLPRNRGTVTLKRERWTLPETVPFGDAPLKPLRGGETLSWRQVA